MGRPRLRPSGPGSAGIAGSRGAGCDAGVEVVQAHAGTQDSARRLSEAAGGREPGIDRGAVQDGVGFLEVAFAVEIALGETKSGPQC
jgi:hypothetical protein